MSGLKFEGKTVVVTGSGTGIGQAIAKKFAENGANIVIMGRRKEPLDNTAAILNEIIRKKESKGKVVTFPGVDVSDEEGINSMFEGIKKEFDGVDVIVNNAGVSGPVKTFTNASVRDFRDCVAIHLTGTFWTSVAGLKVMKEGGKVITISTFFSEENRYEQRPYRFRTPYTASQGAKNRLAECLAWELAERGIRSIATNPGPVHSDRIYKTVYPKAAAEFLRIGGYPELSPTEIEVVTAKALPYLGDSDDVVMKACNEVAAEIAAKRGQSDNSAVTKLATTVKGALEKMQEIAEKIQGNTSKMIVDGAFLGQEDVAEMVLNLSDDKISKLINGRVIPNDRVFYPVKPVVGTGIEILPNSEIKGKLIVLSTTSSAAKDIDRVKKIASMAKAAGAKQVIVLYKNAADEEHFKEFHSHAIDFLNETSIRNIFNTAKTHFGSIDSIIHFTGDYDYNSAFNAMSRNQWDALVDNYIYVPGLVMKEAAIAMAPQGALEKPSLFKGTKGNVIIVGPDAPVGKKISGLLRSRADVFRGALRPYTTTVNQELGDVLGSSIKLHLVLAGNSEGVEPNADRLNASILSLAVGAALKHNEAIFYIDEAKS